MKILCILKSENLKLKNKILARLGESIIKSGAFLRVFLRKSRRDSQKLEGKFWSRLTPENGKTGFNARTGCTTKWRECR